MEEEPKMDVEQSVEEKDVPVVFEQHAISARDWRQEAICRNGRGAEDGRGAVRRGKGRSSCLRATYGGSDSSSEEDPEEEEMEVSESDEGPEEEEEEDSEDEKIREEFENWVWKMKVMDAPWMFRKGRFPLRTWHPNLQTIIEEEEEDEVITEEIPREEEQDEEEEATTEEIPRSSSRRRSILSRLRALFCCCCATTEE
ncbi:microfibrillar-associated protein 1-like isoform X1 [Dendropsophus ebraccatus]|uniref:microfibrillar-associated protein 1-like isoform X1 n=1 Tax=Dendropsophus ebraccatus TaxID=150705 RepID=UPI00383171A6